MVRRTAIGIIGEHGDSEVPVWSLANIAGMRLPAFCAAHGLAHDQTAMDEIFRQTRDAAYAYRVATQHDRHHRAQRRDLLRRGGRPDAHRGGHHFDKLSTSLRDQSTVLSVSSLIEDFGQNGVWHGVSDVCLSLPTVVDRGGVEQVLRLELSPEEAKGLRQSAEVLRAIICQLNLEVT